MHRGVCRSPCRFKWSATAAGSTSWARSTAPREVAWPSDADPGLLESVGLRADGPAVVLHEDADIHGRLLAAGDVVADRPRTVLQAAFDGIRAGAEAAGEPGVLTA